jgi:hypothetical protein
VSFYLLCFRLQLTCRLLQALFIAVRPGDRSHSPSLAGIVHLEFSCIPTPSLFYSVESYQPATVAGLVYLEFAQGSALSHSLAECPTCQPLLQVLPTSSWLSGTANLTSGRLVYLQFGWGIVPPPFTGSQGGPPSLLCALCS